VTKVCSALQVVALDSQADLVVLQTNEFLSCYCNLDITDFDDKAYTHAVATASFPVYSPPVYLSPDTCSTRLSPHTARSARADSFFPTESMRQVIYAKQKYRYRGNDGAQYASRFDTILVRHGRPGPSSGLRAYDIYRAQLFFSITFHGKRLNLCLASVYQKVRSPSSHVPLLRYSLACTLP
jgi:hypothetical protein